MDEVLAAVIQLYGFKDHFVVILQLHFYYESYYIIFI